MAGKTLQAAIFCSIASRRFDVWSSRRCSSTECSWCSMSSTASLPFSSCTGSSSWLRVSTPPAPSRSYTANSRPLSAAAASVEWYADTIGRFKRSLSGVSKGRCSLERVFLVLWCWFCILSPVCVPHLHPGSGLAGRFRLLRRACFPLLQHVVHLRNHEVPHSQHHQHRLHLCWCSPVR